MLGSIVSIWFSVSNDPGGGATFSDGPRPGVELPKDHQRAVFSDLGTTDGRRWAAPELFFRSGGAEESNIGAGQRIQLHAQQSPSGPVPQTQPRRFGERPLHEHFPPFLLTIATGQFSSCGHCSWTGTYVPGVREETERKKEELTSHIARNTTTGRLRRRQACRKIRAPRRALPSAGSRSGRDEHDANI